jgi:hypothetical protein
VRVAPSLVSLVAFLVLGWVVGMVLRPDQMKGTASAAEDATRRIAEIHQAEQRELLHIQQQTQQVDREIARLRQLAEQQKARAKPPAGAVLSAPAPEVVPDRTPVNNPSPRSGPSPRWVGMVDHLKLRS